METTMRKLLMFLKALGRLRAPRLCYALIAVAFLSPSIAEAAARFWVPQPISALANNGSGATRATVASTTGMTTGDSRFFFNVTGTTALTGFQTITVIDSSHIDIAATSFVATGTGSINGMWDANNTDNWVTSTGNTNYGQTVPGSADAVTLDGNSGTGTIRLATSIGGSNALGQLTGQAYTGTFDTATNGPITLNVGGNGFDFSTAASKTLNLGAITINITASGAIGFGTAGTVTIGAASFNYLAPTTFAQAQSFNPGTFGSQFASTSITVSPRTNGEGVAIGANPNAYSLAALTATGPVTIFPATNTNATIGTLNLAGTLSAPVIFASGTPQSTVYGPFITNNPTINYTVLRSIVFNSATNVTANNSWISATTVRLAAEI
jgi:hypothetical protein